jgi:ATPase subunit of ABC transporter with duplicated ATPase domains
MQITLTNISYTYADAPTPALGPISATFAEGWTGIVGNNGSGKSTLLRIATGQLDSFEGSVTPARLQGVYCAQATEELPPLTSDFALDFSNDAMQIRRQFAIDDDWAWRYNELSHGERKRLQIAVALWQNPVILALDEPTNHVDRATRLQLLAALRTYRGVGLLVSHDRELLDELVQQCLFLRPGGAVGTAGASGAGGLSSAGGMGGARNTRNSANAGNTATMRTGNYSAGCKQEALEQKTIARERKTAKDQLAHLNAEQTRRAGEAARAGARRSARHLAKGDSDARARIGLAIVSGQDGKAGRLSAQMGGRLKAAEQRLAAAQVSKTYNGSVWLDTKPSKRPVLLELPQGALPLGAQRTLVHPSLFVENTGHIGLSGPNGAGKSTLITHLVKCLTPDIPLLYIPQELSAAEGSALLAQLKQLLPAQKGQILSIVAQLNSDPARILSGESLSPGELRKLMLAMGMLNNPQLLIMDEPSNHLDLHSIEALEQLLAACPCALLIVSHDEQFLEATTTIRWEFVTGITGGHAGTTVLVS